VTHPFPAENGQPAAPTGPGVPGPELIGPGLPGRPWSVTVASGLLLAAILVLLAQLPVYVYDLLNFGAVVDGAAAAIGASASDAAAAKSASNVTDGVVLVLFGLCVLLLLVCVRGISRPSDPARIATVATCGALFLCCGGQLGVNSVLSGRQSDLMREIAIRQDASYPAWTGLVDYLDLLIYPLLLGALILLLLPASSRYFRPPYRAYLVPLG
jgi:hypothetical protein